MSCCATYRVVSQIDLWFQCLNCQWNMELQRLSADIMCRTRHVFRQPHIFRHAHIHGLSCSSTIFFFICSQSAIAVVLRRKKEIKNSPFTVSWWSSFIIDAIVREFIHCILIAGKKTSISWKNVCNVAIAIQSMIRSYCFRSTAGCYNSVCDFPNWQDNLDFRLGKFRDLWPFT